MDELVMVDIEFNGPGSYQIGPVGTGTAQYVDPYGKYVSGTGLVGIEEGAVLDARKIRGTVDVVFEVNGVRSRLLKGFEALLTFTE